MADNVKGIAKLGKGPKKANTRRGGRPEAACHRGALHEVCAPRGESRYALSGNLDAGSAPSYGPELMWMRSVEQLPGSTLDHVQGEAGQRSLLVARLHIEASLVHRLDDLIERDLVAF